MKTVLSGRVTAADIADAELIADITPTSFLVHDRQPAPPAELGLTTEVFPICKMRDEDGAILARHYTLANAGEALICVGRNDHLVSLARRYGLKVYAT